MSTVDSSSSKTRKKEYRVRFDSDGCILGESYHSSLGKRLGIALGDEKRIGIFDYLKRVEVLDSDLADRLCACVKDLLDGHKEFSLSGDFAVDNAHLNLHISGRVVRNLSGGETFTLLFLDDTAHTKLRRSYEYMFRLANHELKGPLACILGACEYAEEHIASKSLEGIKTCVEMIERNAQSVEDMVSRYLNLSRIESGSFTVDLSDVILSSDVVNPLMGEMQHSLRARGMTVTFECENMDHEHNVSADREKTEIVLRNLLSNAVKYGDPDSTISVILSRKNNNYEVSVRNKGPNIPENYLRMLFEKFVRLDATRGTKGSGLGLYNARKLVELWGGTISVASGDSTTTFTFSLPND